MKAALLHKLKRLLSVCLLLMVFVGLVPMQASAATPIYGTLGTFSSIGSPLLNPSFSTSQWNRWEMIAWGVYLSNFVVPLVDTYSTAFSAGATTGSKGGGQSALRFGVGDDAQSKSIIQAFTAFAVQTVSSESIKELKMTLTEVNKFGKVILTNPDNTKEILEPNDPRSPFSSAYVPGEDILRTATFDGLVPSIKDSGDAGDLLLESGELENTQKAYIRHKFETETISNGSTSAEVKEDLGGDKFTGLGINKTTQLYRLGDNSLTGSNENVVARLATFWLSTDSGYVRVWDELDPWDLQMTGTVLGHEAFVGAGTEDATARFQEFSDNFNTLFGGGTSGKLGLDCFGNIVTASGLMVIPAYANKHITKTPIVNLVNATILTAATTGADSSVVLARGMESVVTLTEWVTNAVTAYTQLDSSGTGEGFLDNGMPLQAGAVSAFSGESMDAFSGGVALYLDTDRVFGQTLNGSTQGAVQVGGQLHGQAHAEIMLADLDKSRQVAGYTITPRLDIFGAHGVEFFKNIAKLTGTSGGTAWTHNDNDLYNLTEMITYGGILSTYLPAASNEAATQYKHEMFLSSSGVKNPIDLFDSPVLIPAQMPTGSTLDKGTNQRVYTQFGIVRSYLTYYMNCVLGKETSESGGVSSKVDLLNRVAQTGMPNELEYALLFGSSSSAGKSRVNSALLSYFNKNPTYANSAKIGSEFSWSEVQQSLDYSKGGDKSFINFDILKELDASWLPSTDYTVAVGYSTSGGTLGQRWVKTWTINKAFVDVAKILGMRGGSEEMVAATSPWIYLNYLKIYGVNNVVSLKANSNPTYFDERIFDASGTALTVDIESLLGAAATTDEDRDRATKLNLFKLLDFSNKSSGEYRRQFISGIFSEFFYDMYERAVFGGTDKYGSSDGNSVMRNDGLGFLRIPKLDENLITGKFLMPHYSTFVLYALAFGLIIILVMGLFRHKKLLWFFGSILTLTVALVVLPTVNDLASVGMDATVQGLMNDKMTLWSVAEQAQNEISERYLIAVSAAEDGDASEKLTAALLSDLKIIYGDRSLSLKQDISRKLNNTDGIQELLKFASTRWVLPVVMRQFSTADSGTNFLYIPMCDVLDDAANAYWYVYPGDAEGVETRAGSQQGVDAKSNWWTATGTYSLSSGKTDNYSDFLTPDRRSSLIGADVNSDGSFRSTSYISGDVSTYNPRVYGAYDKYTTGMFDSLDALRPHNVVYRLNAEGETVGGINLKGFDPSGGAEKTNAEAVWREYYDSIINNPTIKSSYEMLADSIEKKATTYDRTDRNKINDFYNYMWSTESLYPYFYALTKDTVYGWRGAPEADSNYGVSTQMLVSYLQGQYQTVLFDTEGEVKIPYGNMYQGVVDGDYTGFTRDIADLEDIFYNVVPYMYGTTLAACGLDGESGFLTKPIKEYSLYKGLPQGWLLRSNWVIKIAASPEFNKAETIAWYDDTGARLTAEIEGSYMPQLYLNASNNQRRMVFSEAQMYADGLREADLTMLELKCIETNKAIVKKWESALNYIQTPGLSSEVALRQMALDAMLIFNQNLQPQGFADAAFKLYPNSIDLRSLSFDSIVKVMLVDSASGAGFVYDNAMRGVTSQFGFGTVLTLLLDAWACCLLVPLVRMLLLAELLLVGLFSVLKSLFRSGMRRGRTILGYISSIGLLFLFTYLYYLLINALMLQGAGTSVINDGVSAVTSTNVSAILLFLLAGSLAYVGLMCFLGFLVWKNKDDLGMEKYIGAVSLGAGKVRGAVRSLTGRGGGGDIHSVTNNSSTSNSSSVSNSSGTVSVSTAKSKNISNSKVTNNSGGNVGQVTMVDGKAPTQKDISQLESARQLDDKRISSGRSKSSSDADVTSADIDKKIKRGQE